jgi:quercetin dioxygenase-like cupin family protein
MRSATLGSFLFCAAALAAPAAGQTPPAAPAITRMVLASTKLPTVGDTPVHFKAVRVTIPSEASSSVSSTNGILYQLSGSTEVSIGGEVKTLSPGEGFFIGSGNAATLKAGDGEPSTFLHFLLASTADLDKPLEASPAVVQELYRTAAPLPALKPGPYDLSLTRVTFPAQMPSNPPHYRSGAALLHHLWNGRKHGRRQVRNQDTRFFDLRTFRSRAPVGKSECGAVDILGIQHQPGRCGCRPSRCARERSVVRELERRLESGDTP